MKYIDADKLITEIDSIWKHYIDSDEYDNGFNDALDKVKDFITSLQVKDFITSLQQEQLEVDLEKEIEKTIRSVFFDLAGIAIIGTSAYASVEDMEYIARHFYELGLKARKEDAK